MARTRDRLTDRQVRTAKDGWHADGGNLYLRVADDGRRRSWVLRYTSNGRTAELGLGAAAMVTLKQARALRDQHLKKRTEGLDPLAEKRRADAERANRKTFGEMAEATLRLNAGLGASSRAEWARHLSRDCKPLATKLVEEITVDDVKRVVAPYWDAGKHETARRLLARVEAVLSYAIAHGYRSAGNVAAWSVFKHVAPKTSKNGDKPHHAAIRYADMPALMARLRAVDSMASLALQFAILTAARSGEVRGMTWAEIDLDAGMWVAPRARMKARREHQVPLPGAALDILRKLEKVRYGDPFVFPGRRPRKPLANASIWSLIKKLAGDEALKAGARWRPRGDPTGHGMRSAFRDWCGDATSFPREVAEAALAHKIGDATEQAYRRGTALEKRRALMQAWADFLGGFAHVQEPDGKAGVLLPFKGKRRA